MKNLFQHIKMIYYANHIILIHGRFKLKFKTFGIFTTLLFASLCLAKGNACDNASNCQSPKNAQGQINGEEKCHDHKGKLVRLSTYKDGVLNGPWKCFSESGQLTESKEFKSGKLDGISKKWDEKLKKFSECSYKVDKKDGFCMTYSQNTYQGKTEYAGKTVSSFKEGREHGWQIKYDSKDKEEKRTCFQNGRVEVDNPNLCGSEEKKSGDGKKSGQFEVRDAKGRLQSIENWENSQLHGLSKDFNNNGTLVHEAHYVKSELKGLETFYFDSGKVKEKTLWLGLNNIDSREAFYENGKLKLKYKKLKASTQPYEHEVYAFERYFDNGQLEMKGKCLVSQMSFGSSCDGLEGTWVYFNEDGTPKAEENYKNNQLNGLAKTFEKNQIIATTYDNGKKTKMVITEKGSSKIVKSEEYNSDGSRRP